MKCLGLFLFFFWCKHSLMEDPQSIFDVLYSLREDKGLGPFYFFLLNLDVNMGDYTPFV